ncbi:MAG: acyl-CoA dehydrogenase, partial [Proteobacteria bacterium]|nr:acyl-CoA dehydrogenase [Pseudomonadota bacterium]
AMQVMGGIGYTSVFPIERIHRDLRLASIWTGTNEVMAMIIAHEWYREYFKSGRASQPRDYEADAEAAMEMEEKIYE